MLGEKAYQKAVFDVICQQSSLAAMYLRIVCLVQTASKWYSVLQRTVYINLAQTSRLRLTETAGLSC